MFGWLRRLLTPARPSRRELAAAQNQLDGLEERVEYVYAELKKLRGRVYANERREKAPEDQPGEAIAGDPDPQHHPSDNWYRPNVARGYYGGIRRTR